MKRAITLFICVCLFANMFSTSYAAALSEISVSPVSSVRPISSNKEPLTEDLTRVTVAVKSKIDIPEGLTEFSYNFYAERYNADAYWSLNWTNKERTESVTVTVDQNENILSYYHNTRNKNGESNTYAPIYLQEELKPKADEFIKRIAPIFGQLKYKGATADGIYAGTYTYTYERFENRPFSLEWLSRGMVTNDLEQPYMVECEFQSIAMPDNSVKVTINYETGEVTSINIDWLYDAIIPNPDTNITEEQAKAKLGENVKMELVYKNKYIEEDGKQKIKAFLVYIPDKSYIAVDAKTGEVYLDKEEWIEKSDYAKEEMALDSGAMNKSISPEVSLTEEEIAKIEELNTLISREEAIKAVTGQKAFLIDESLMSIEANLTKNYSYRIIPDNADDQGYIWNVYLSDPRSVDYKSNDTYRAYASATVDAKTGAIISFRASVKGYYDKTNEQWNNVNVKYDIKKCQQVFETFVKTQIPEKFKNTKASTQTEDYILKYIKEVPVYGGYNYTYNRVNEGIEYPYNSIRGAVDGVTGKIYNFSYNWNDNVEFESPKKAMSEKEAFKNYIAKDGFHLIYEINSKNIYDKDYSKSFDDSIENKKEVRLVYRPDIDPNWISPFTGKQLDYEGEEYKGKENYVYEDIDSSWAKKQIMLLADMGLGFEGKSFMPDKTITKGEFEELIKKVAYSQDETDKESKDLAITKSKAVKSIIEKTSYHKIAELKEIFNTNFADNDKISEEDIGFVALAKGLGIIKGDSNNNFNPDRQLTRAEAAAILINFMSIDIR